MDSPTLPQMRLPVLEKDGTFILPWYRKFQDISSAASGGVTPAQLAAAVAAEAALRQAADAVLQAQIDALDGGDNLLGYIAISELDGYGG